MSRLNTNQTIFQQGLITTLNVDNLTDVLLEDQDGSVARPYSTVQQAMDHINHAPPAHFGVVGEQFCWKVWIGPGTYNDVYTIPSNRSIVIESQARNTELLGNCTWITEGNFTTLVGFRNINIGNMTIQDGYTPAALAILVFENAGCGSITQTGSSVINASFAGISNVSTLFAGGLGASSVVGGDLIINGLVIADNTAFLPSCTVISAYEYEFSDCIFEQDIIASQAAVNISGGCQWLQSNKKIHFTGSSGIVLMDGASQFSFSQNQGTIVNGNLVFEGFAGYQFATTLYLDSLTPVPTNYQNGSVSYPFSNFISAFNFINQQKSLNPNLTNWYIKVGTGLYPENFTIPEGLTFVIEGSVNGQCFLTGNVTWKATGQAGTRPTSAVDWRNITVGPLTIQDGYIPAINAILVGENAVFNGISQTGTSFITATLVGGSLANLNVSTLVISSRVNATIHFNGLLFATNTAFLPGCASIHCQSLFANGSSFNQNITLDDSTSQFTNCAWNIANALITHLGANSVTSMDENTAATFLDLGGRVINSRFLLSTQRDTGWLSGGLVTRTSGLGINITDGYGYIFQFDDVTEFVNWNNTNLTLPPNSQLNIYVDSTGTVQFATLPVSTLDFIVLATIQTNSNNVVFLSKDIVQPLQLAINTDTYLQYAVGPTLGNNTGILASIHSPPSLQLDVTSGYFFVGLLPHQVTANSSINFTYWYMDGYGGWKTVVNQNIIDTNKYDNGTGTLANLNTGFWKKDWLFVATSDSGTEYHIVYGQQAFTSETLAQFSNFSSIPEVIKQEALKCAGVVVQGVASFITIVTDERSIISNSSSGSGTPIVAGNGLTSFENVFSILPNPDNSIVVNSQGVKVGALGFPSVASGLGAGAGSHANYVFKSNGSGSGTMGLNTQVINNVITVGTGVDVDFTSVAAAVTFAQSQGASLSNIYKILIYPGNYIEPPIILSSGIILRGFSTLNDFSTNLIASNPSADFITITTASVGIIESVTLSGVTDPIHACIRISGFTSAGQFSSVLFTNCYNGIFADNQAAFNAYNCGCVIDGPNQSVVNVFKIDNATAQILNPQIIVLPAILSLYSTNPVQIGISINNNGELFVSSGIFNVSDIDHTSSAIFADGGSNVTIFASQFTLCSNAVHIGSFGSNTQISVQGSNLSNNILNFKIESATGSIFEIVSIDQRSNSLVDGSALTGIAQIRSTQATDLIGKTNIFYDTTDRTADLLKFLTNFGETGLISGGVVTAGTGLHVNVADGYGWSVRGAPQNDITSIFWNNVTNLPLTANMTNYIVYDGASQSIISLLAPGNSSDIELAQVVTDGYGIRFLHTTAIPINNSINILEQYLLDTRTFILRSGLVVSQGSTNHKFSITAGSYYRATEIISFPGVSDATFSYFYDSGLVEIANQTVIDDSHYDNNGFLTVLDDGYFKADTIYITSDGRVEVIYSTQEYTSMSAAQGAMAASSFNQIAATGFLLYTVISGKNIGIQTFVDHRPTGAASTGTGGGGGVTVHGQLLGLLADDHPQYLLTNGGRVMTGSLNVGGNDITNVNLVDGIIVHAHANRHNPGGSDALAIGTPINTLVGAAPSAGSAASYSLSDHQHGIAAGTPLSVSTTNSAGTASSVARSDHVHAHGLQTDPNQHALATELSAGFMSASDKFTVDNSVISVDGYTNSHETLRQLIHFIDHGPATGFASLAFREITPTGNPFPTAVTWYVSSAKTQKIVETLITRNTNKTPSTIVWNMYATDGVTIIHSVSDAITYSGIIESSRIRTIT